MSGVNPAQLAEVGQRLYVFFLFVFTCKALNPMGSSRLSTKVIFQIMDPCESEAKVNRCTNS